MKAMRIASALLFLAALAVGPCALAQDITASISGNVTDASGSAVAGATISITATDRNVLLRTTKTDNDGNYTAPFLPVGVYSISAESKGFKTSIKSGIQLNVNDTLTISFKLEVGDVKDVVTVEAAPVQVELQNGGIQSTTINGTQIRELALVTRNYEQLVALMPGVSSASVDQLYVGTTLPSGQTATVPFAINGARNSMNAWLVDGADNVDRGSNQTLLNTPSIDAIAEFKVLRSGYDASAGRAGGGQVSVITKSGTAGFHGDAYEFVRNNAFAANNFYNNATLVNLGPDGKANVAPLHYNNFGWTLGGPIFIPGHYNKDKNKTFFFVSQEFRRVITYATGTATVPTQAELNGIFPTPVCISSTGSTCNQTATSIANIDPIAKAYIKDVYSKLSLPTANNTLVSLFRNVYNFEQEIYKLDHNFGPKLQVSARFLRDQIPTQEPQGLFTTVPLPGVSSTSTNAPGHNWTFRGTSSLSPTWFNEAGYSYSYGALISNPTGAMNSAYSPDVKPTLPYTPTLTMIPGVTLSGGTSLLSYGPYRDYNRNHNVFDNMTKIHGNHTIRFGAVYNHYQKTENAAGSTSYPNQGVFAFAPSVTPSGTSTFSQSFANFLLGSVATFTQASQDITPDIHANSIEFYGQDDWKVTPRLTINVGLRYSLFRQPTDANGQLVNFDPKSFSASAVQPLTAGGLFANNYNAFNYQNGLIIGGKNSRFGDVVSTQSYNNFAPRLGFAWDPFGTGKTSIRGGYGIFYDATLYGIYEQNLFGDPPVVNVVTINGTTFANPGGGTTVISSTPKAIHATPTTFNTPYQQQWSLSVERQITRTSQLNVAYVGSKGTHLLGIIDINQVYPNFAYTSGFAPPSTNYTSSTAELPLNNLRPYPGYNAINTLEPWFNSNYNSFQVQATKRFSNAAQVTANYTWSKNMTDNGSDRSNAPQNSYNFNQGEYGPAPFDRTQVFNVNFVYPLPFFVTQQGITGKILGGWQLSMIGQYYTGLPYTVTTSNSDPAALGLIGSSASSARPDLLCNPYANWTSTRTSWFNTACFINPAAGSQRVGNEGRSVLRGPGYEGWSLRVSKTVSFGEQRFKLNVIGEASNAFNHTNPSTFGSTNNTSSLFGTITGYRDPRIIQLGAKFYF